jgi:hypothetical protein
MPLSTIFQLYRGGQFYGNGIVCLEISFYINFNKAILCLIISYLRIKSYNVLNYNNCSTDWSFPLNIILIIVHDLTDIKLTPTQWNFISEKKSFA